MQPRRRARIAILLNREQDVAVWRERHARGETMDVTPYGYERAADRYELAWSVSAPEGRIRRAIRVRTAGALGFDLVHAWRNRRLLFSADAVWTHTEREHLAVAVLQRLRRKSSRVPVLAQSVWLWDVWPHWSAPRRRFVAWLLRTHAVEAVHSRLNRDASSEAVPGRTVTLLPFGSAAVTREPPNSPAASPLILAVGNDADRDWGTLAAALAHVDGAHTRIASKSRSARDASWPPSVTVSPTSSLEELAALYRSAAVVVVPVRPNLHASGATSCIEALAARRPLVVSAAGGLSDYVGDAAIVVAPGDAVALAAGIRAALTGNSAPTVDRWLEYGLTQADYVERYVLLTKWLLEGAGWPSAVAEFAPVTPR